jgi:hypothetical protein
MGNTPTAAKASSGHQRSTRRSSIPLSLQDTKLLVSRSLGMAEGLGSCPIRTVAYVPEMEAND